MLRALFSRQGEFCARHPMEVVVSTLTVITCLMSFGSSLQHNQDKVCGWNYECAKEQKLKSTDVIMLSVARCMALVYIYLQFRHLRRLGSKHVLGISGVFTIFSSFVFSIAFVKMYGNTMAGLYEVLPFFLFLIDLSKASALAVFALSSTTKGEIHENIGKAMALLGPSITLDMVVETLAVGVGTLSGVQQLEAMCSFGCLSVVANYVAFMTFYPACLALVLELSMDLNASNQSAVRYKKLAEELQEDHNTKKPNPVTQRVKFIMSIGLAVVHIHSRLIAPRLAASSSELSETIDMYREPIMSFWQFYLYKIFAVHVDYGLTLLLGIGLLLKYVFVDRHNELIEIKHSLELQRSFNSVSSETQTDGLYEPVPAVTEDHPHFSLGDDSKEGSSTDEEGMRVESRDTQTDAQLHGLSPLKRLVSLQQPRSIEECLVLLKTENGVNEMTDEEIKLLVNHKHIPAYKLEGVLGDHERGVSIRRQMVMDHAHFQRGNIDSLPYSNYDYSFVDGACCENVVGYMPVPVGTAGPLVLDGRPFMVPMATTEGCLVASTNRGCRALSQCGGVHSSVIGDGMTRGPVVRFPSAIRASKVKAWLEDSDNFDLIKESFDLTSRFARLQKLHVAQAGRQLYIRFVAKTGDAMGMNMLSKGTEKALNTLQEVFSDMEILSLSGNFCTDKKSSAINWIEGRGKSVVCEAIVPARVVKNVLKTSVRALVDLNINKNLVGSAMAGSIGGFNAHAANVVAAIFIATGQDPAQTVASCSCITLMEATGENGEDLYISCTMPSIEVGTVGGGTILPPQLACLQMLGVDGSAADCPGENARQLARVVCGTVLAGELSLMSALAAGHLVRSHLKHNRSSISLGTSSLRDTLSASNIPFTSTPDRVDPAHNQSHNQSMPAIHTPPARTTGEATPHSCIPGQPELSPLVNKDKPTTIRFHSDTRTVSERVRQDISKVDIRQRRANIPKEGGDRNTRKNSSDLGENVGTCIKHVS